MLEECVIRSEESGLRHRFGLLRPVAALTLWLVLPFTPAPRPACAELSCSIHQLTATVDGYHGGASLTPDGKILVYARSDPGSGGAPPDDQLHFAPLVAGTPTQLTSGEGVKGNPSVAADGRWLAFQSQTDHTGGNPDGNLEIYLLDRVSGAIVQASDSTHFNNFRPRITADGGGVLFSSWNDLVGENADGSLELFLFDRSTGDLDQITDSAGLVNDFDIGSGSLVALSATDDFTGLNADGNPEIFLLDAASGVFEQVTDTVDGRNTSVTLDASASRMAFFSSSEDLIGPNPTGLLRLFFHDRNAGGFEQLSTGPFEFFSAQISGDGSRVVGSLDCVVHLWDLPSGETVEVVQPEGPFVCLNDVSDFSHDGSLFVLRSFGEPAGSNPESNIELFLVSCPRPAVFADGFESGDLSAWTPRSPRPGALAVTAAAAAAGTGFGLEVSAGTPCEAPTELILAPPPATVQGLHEACSRLRASGVGVEIPGATFRAGDSVHLGNGFSVDLGATLVVELDPALSPFTFVEDDSPARRASYMASFFLRLDALSLGAEDHLDHLNGYSRGKGALFRLTLRPSGAPGGFSLSLSARNEDGSYSETPPAAAIPLASGWNAIELSWRAGDGTGHLLVSANGGSFSGLDDLSNHGAALDFVRWGAVDGVVDSAAGTIEMDEFVYSQ